MPRQTKNQTKNATVLELARRGAEARFGDLLQELKYLVDLFPHLRDTFDPGELPISFLLATGAQQEAPSRRRGRRAMSAAARKAQSVKMKQYWTKQRAARKSG